jgi:hypothetical protein
MKSHYQILGFAFSKVSRLVLATACLISTGCGVLENAILYNDFQFMYETSYPKGTMTVQTPRIFTSKEYAKSEVFRAAENYCKSRGHVMIPIRFQWLPPIENTSSMGNYMAAASLMFRSMSPSDPEIKNPRTGPVNQPEYETF